MKLIQKYGKKKIYIASTTLVVACIAIGITTWYIMEQNYKQKVLDSIEMTFVEEASIEYGTEKVDYNALIKEKIGEPEVLLPTEEINTKELGKKQVTYVLSKDGHSKKETLDIEIKDTQFPVIEFNEKSILLEIDEEYDVKSNIKTIEDLVDGDIPSTEDETITKDGYIINSNVDTSKVGEYTVKLIAYDKNGNKSEKEYVVSVVEKDKMNEPSYNTSGGTQGNPNLKPTTPTNPNGNTTDSSNGNSNSATTKPVTCPNGKEPFKAELPCDAVISGPWNQADPKIQFDSDEDAYNYGWSLFMNDNAYSDKYRDFVTAPCLRNDGSSFNIITPTLK